MFKKENSMFRMFRKEKYENVEFRRITGRENRMFGIGIRMNVELGITYQELNIKKGKLN